MTLERWIRIALLTPLVAAAVMIVCMALSAAGLDLRVFAYYYHSVQVVVVGFVFVMCLGLIIVTLIQHRWPELRGLLFAAGVNGLYLTLLLLGVIPGVHTRP